MESVGEITVPIEVYDKFNVLYTSSSAVTGFSGDLSTFTFKIDESAIKSSLLDISNSKIEWLFGDGTKSLGLSATHTYNFPGEYTVQCFLFDSDGDPHKSTEVSLVQIKNYFSDSVLWGTGNQVVTAGRISSELPIQRYNSWQSYNSVSATGYTVNVYASGSNSNFVTEKQYNSDPNIHFQKLSKIVDNTENLTPVDSVSTTNELFYFKTLSSPNAGGTLIESTSSEEGSIFVGTTGQNIVHYIDDSANDNFMYLFASLDTGNFPTRINSVFNIPRDSYIDLDIDYFITKPAVLPVSAVENIPSKLLITPNGISQFTIGENKWERSPISYVVSVADSDNNIIKDIPKLSSGIHTNGNYIVSHGLKDIDKSKCTYYSNTGVGFEQYGSLSNFVVVSGTTTSDTIAASAVVDLPYGGGTATLVGESNAFKISPLSGTYNISKVGEEVDFTEILKSYILQDTIANKTNFINWFLTKIFGTDVSDVEGLGKTVYEKIENFVSNNSDIDTCNINALYSIAQELDLVFEDYRYKYPAGIKRLVDILSIKHRRLFGFRSQANTDFDQENYNQVDDNVVYGRNLGDLISVSAYVVSAGTPIVANELFTNSFTLINTMLLPRDGSWELFNKYTNYNLMSSYPLSSYDESWGWGLSLPSDEDSSGFSKYYDFYEYKSNSQYELSSFDAVQTVIDFDSSTTTLTETNSSIDEWTKTYGIVDNIFDHRLRKGLGLFDVDISSTAVLSSAGFNVSPSLTPSISITPSVSISTTPGSSVTPSISISTTPNTSATPSVTPSSSSSGYGY